MYENQNNTKSTITKTADVTLNIPKIEIQNETQSASLANSKAIESIYQEYLRHRINTTTRINPIEDFQTDDNFNITGSTLLNVSGETGYPAGTNFTLVIHLRQNIGTDVAVLNGMMNVIIEEDLYDKEFVETRTEEFDQLKEVVSKYPPEVVEKISGIASRRS